MIWLRLLFVTSADFTSNAVLFVHHMSYTSREMRLSLSLSLFFWPIHLISYSLHDRFAPSNQDLPLTATVTCRGYRYVLICTQNTHRKHRNLSVWLPPSLSVAHTHTHTQKTHCCLSRSPGADVTGWMGASKGKLKQTQSSAEASKASGSRREKINVHLLLPLQMISLNQTVIQTYLASLLDLQNVKE